MALVQQITDHKIEGQYVQVKSANSKEKETESNRKKTEGKGSQSSSQKNGNSSQFSSKQNIQLPSANVDMKEQRNHPHNYHSDRFIAPQQGNIYQNALPGRNSFSNFVAPHLMNPIHSDVNIATFSYGYPVAAGNMTGHHHHASDNLLKKPSVIKSGHTNAKPHAFYPSQSMKEIRKQIPSVKAIAVREGRSPKQDFSPGHSNASSRGHKTQSNFQSTFKEQSMINQQCGQAKRYISPAPLTSFNVRTYPGSQVIWGHTIEGNARINIPLFESKQSEFTPRHSSHLKPTMRPNRQWCPIEEENNEQSDLEKMSLDGRDVFG